MMLKIKTMPGTKKFTDAVTRSFNFNLSNKSRQPTITQFLILQPDCDSSSRLPVGDFGSGPRKQEQNALNSSMGLKLGRFRPVTFDVDGENYRVSLSPYHNFNPILFFSCLHFNLAW